MTRIYRAAIVFVAVLLVSMSIRPATASPSPGIEPGFSVGATQELDTVAIDVADDDAERYLLDMINQERLANARSPLVRNVRLDELARQKAWDMARHRYFDHVSPRFGTVFDMLAARGIAYKWAGENIARATSEAMAHEALMASPGHRANILSAGYTDVGIGVVLAGGKRYVAQIFMKPPAP